MRRKKFRLQPQVEGLESMTLLSGASAAMVHAAAVTRVALRGTVAGSYLARQGNPGTGATIQLAAGGPVSPLAGRSTVSGTARVPGFVQNALVQGTLTVRGPQGSIIVRIGGLITTPPSSAQKVTYGFGYVITGGTGQFSNVRGNGILLATLTPSSAPTSRISVGTLILTFK